MGKLIDLAGQRFGFWLVKSRGINKSGRAQWLCVCECGIERLVTSNSLKTGNSTSCSCNHVPNLVDQHFGKLTVLDAFISNDKNRRYWNCQCRCGNTIIVSTYKLREGIVKSCGCNFDCIKKVMVVGKQFGNLLDVAANKFIEAEKLITGGNALSNMSRMAMMKQGLQIIHQQMQILTDINQELQKDMDNYTLSP
jgi:hypothetical protein